MSTPLKEESLGLETKANKTRGLVRKLELSLVLVLSRILKMPATIWP